MEASATRIKEEAKRLGFDLVGVAPAIAPPTGQSLLDWLDAGFAGEMNYMERRREAYATPDAVMDGARSIVMLGLNYAQPHSPAAVPGMGIVSRYAVGQRDYHDVIRGMLAQLATYVKTEWPGVKTRGIVDTAPLLERDFARLAGLGWFGKNTLLINKQMGSFFFLAALLTDIEIPPDASHHTSHCGTCTRCLEACPTDAFVEPYVLDARKCISYLTIELRSPVPMDLRKGIGDWIFGCDICQDVCPWNRKAPRTRIEAFEPRADLLALPLAELFELSESKLKSRFGETPLWRTGRAGLLRNAALVLGNQAATASVPALTLGLNDTESLVRGASAWALGQIATKPTRVALTARLDCETNADVRTEITAALERIEERKLD